MKQFMNSLPLSSIGAYLPVVVISFFTPIMPLFVVSGVLIFTDFIFGVYRSHKLGIAITSRKMSNSISKVVLYNLVILSAYVVQIYILKTDLGLERLVTGIIGFVELVSIDEAFKSIFGYSIISKLKEMISRGQSNTKIEDLFEDVSLKEEEVTEKGHD